MSVAIAVGLLTAAGVYLLLRRELIRVVVGFVLLGHAVNLVLLSAGGLDRRDPPLGATDPRHTADPLPQAFVLTAIVITFGITVYLLGLAALDTRAGARRPGDGAGQRRAATATGPDGAAESPEPTRTGEGPGDRSADGSGARRAPRRPGGERPVEPE